MFDARYVAFAALSALLVISPGATFAVVVETALGYGRKAALLTVAGIGLGNGILAAATAFGLSAVVGRWPSALQSVRFCGGGVPRVSRHPRIVAVGLRHQRCCGRREGARRDCRAFRIRGQGRADEPAQPAGHPLLSDHGAAVHRAAGRLPGARPRLERYARRDEHRLAGFVRHGRGVAAEHMGRPGMRRTLEGVTSAILVFLGARLLL